MIRRVRVPAGSRVLVLGDTAFEARQVRAACAARGFDWGTPANPERVLAGKKGRKRLREWGKDLDAETVTRIELCPGLTAWWRHRRGSKAKAWRGKYARRYWARAEALGVHNVGHALAVFPTNERPRAGQEVQAKEVLLSNLLHWDAARVVSAYAARWQVEINQADYTSSNELYRGAAAGSSSCHGATGTGPLGAALSGIATGRSPRSEPREGRFPPRPPTPGSGRRGPRWAELPEDNRRQLCPALAQVIARRLVPPPRQEAKHECD
jgi:hypothetical protein